MADDAGFPSVKDPAFKARRCCDRSPYCFHPVVEKMAPELREKIDRVLSGERIEEERP